MEIYSRPFDREFGLQELLSGTAMRRLEDSLRVLLGDAFRLVSETGEVLLGGKGEAVPGMGRAEIRHDLETLGYLESVDAGEDRLRAAVSLLELMMQVSARYYMASELHIVAVQSDYEALQQEHAALVESDARYKVLSETLEQRVQEQVKAIQSAHRRLYQAEKMASVGQLAAGMAHEINNPIGFIRSNLGTARSYVEKFAHLGAAVKADGAAPFAAWQATDMEFVLQDFDELLRESQSGADRVARIVADLKDFSNLDQAEEETINLNHGIRSVCNVAAGEFSDRAEMVLELGELPPLRCRPGHINQALLNLLRNAAGAMERRGEIRIQSAACGDEVRIRVADTGTGIAPTVLPRIFEPFFTTREVGRGIGLGLTVSRDIVNAHGGRIEVESKVGAGTTVTVHLPIRRAIT